MHSSNDIPNLQNELQHQADGPECQFLISQERLAELVEIYHRDPLQRRGGIENIVSELRTNIDTGIIGDQGDLHLRRKAFGSNLSLKERSPQMTNCFKRLLLDALKDTTILLLLCCATLSLVIGIRTNGIAEAAADAAHIFLAISIVVTFGAIFRFCKARWMIKKSMKHKKVIWLVRNGKFCQIPESELVAGDIAWLQTGDRVPADGIFIDGNSFQLNDCLEKGCSNCSHYFSLFTGAKVVKGCCRMLVMSVGENTERRRLIRSIGVQQNDHQDRKLRLLDAIDKNNSKLEKIWLSLLLILLVVQLVRCFVWKPVDKADKDRNLDPKGVKNTMEDLMNEFVKLMKKERSKASGLVTMLCVLIFASRDGLPLAIFVSLLYASKKMKSCEAIVQKVPASATVGLVTTICTGKTNDLVLQYAKMAEFWVGFYLIDGNVRRQVANEILDALREGILVQSNSKHGRIEEVSLLAWAREVLGLNMEFHRDCSVVRRETPDMDRDLSCSIVKRDNSSSGADKVLHVHWKGAPEIILSMCSHYFTVDGTVKTLDDNERLEYLQIVHNLVACSQCCFAFAYKREIVEEEEEGEGVETLKSLEHDLTLLGFVGLKNPYSHEVREAIEDCRNSGVRVKLMVDDDIDTARIMAMNSGLLRPEDDNGSSTGALVDAADFRTSSEEDRMNMIDNIHVMANASPADKLLMVQCTRRKGERVAATASCIRDGPLLKEADVGVFMGDECADLSKEDGDILVRNKNFSQIPGIMKLGGRVCENLEKFIQLQLTLEISAFTVNNIISIAASSKEGLSAFQLLWINLSMQILGALAVAITTIHTQSSHTELGNTKRVYGSGAVVTRTMYRKIAVQSLFQVTVILILEMKGKSIFQVKGLALRTMIFNCYAFCQVFLLLTGIKLKKNDVVAGLFTGRNCLYLGIVAIIGILQLLLVEIMGVVANWSKLDMKEWCICIGIASFSVPLSCAANWMPSSTK